MKNKVEKMAEICCCNCFEFPPKNSLCCCWIQVLPSLLWLSLYQIWMAPVLTLCSFTIRSTFLIESDLELCHHHQYDYKLPLSSFPELFPRERKEKGSEEISSYVGSHQQQTISDAFLHHDSRSVFRKGRGRTQKFEKLCLH